MASSVEAHFAEQSYAGANPTLRQNYKHSVARGQISMLGAQHGLSVVVDPVLDGQTIEWKKVGFVVGDQCYAQCHGMRGDELI